MLLQHHSPVIRYSVFTCFLSLLTLAGWSSSLGQNNEEVDLPIRRVTLYNTGISQIQREGALTDSKVVKLNVPDTQIDDVLKSLVFLDNADGTVRGIQYQSAPTSDEMTLREFESPLTLAQLLQKYRGQQIELEFTQENRSAVTTKIWTVENRTVEGNVVETLIGWTDGQLQAFAIPDIRGIRFSNDDLNQQMETALLGLANPPSAERHNVEVHFQGQGKRNVGLGYVIDSTIWRTTYRLDLEEKKATLQALAHIDNASDDDWEHVELILRSGRPNVFHVELFVPKLAVRPSVGQAIFDLPRSLNLQYPNLVALDESPSAFDTDSASGAQTSNDDYGYGGYGYGGFGSRGGGGFAMGGGGMGGGGGGMGGGGGFAGRGYGGLYGNGGSPPMDDDMTPTEVPLANVRDTVADAGRASMESEFKIQESVSLKKGQSLAVPILNEELKVQTYTQVKLDITDNQGKAEVDAGWRTANLTNNSKHALMGGPVAVSQDGDFLGDFALGKMDINDQASITYAADRSVLVSSNRSPATTQLVRISWVEGNFVKHFHHISRTDIVLKNKDPEVKEIRITFSEPYLDQWEEDQLTPEPAETDGQKLTYSRSVPGTAEVQIPFSFSGTTQEDYRLAVRPEKELEAFLADTDLILDDEVRGRFQRFLDASAKLEELRKTRQEKLDTQRSVQQRLTTLNRNALLLKWDAETAKEHVQDARELAKEDLELSVSLNELDRQIRDLAKVQDDQKR